MRKIRVLLAEDAAVIRRVVCEALQESGQIEVVAAAVNGKHAVELFTRAQPEVAVLDMELPEMNEVFSAYFPVDPPARTTFECARLIRDARVEIEAIAIAS